MSICASDVDWENGTAQTFQGQRGKDWIDNDTQKFKEAPLSLQTCPQFSVSPSALLLSKHKADKKKSLSFTCVHFSNHNIEITDAWLFFFLKDEFLIPGRSVYSFLILSILLEGIHLWKTWKSLEKGQLKKDVETRGKVKMFLISK